MANEPREADENRQDTEYAPTSRAGVKPGFVLSAWSVALGAVALVIVISGLLLI